MHLQRKSNPACVGGGSALEWCDEHAKVFDFYLEFTSSRCVGAFMDTMRSKDVKIVSFDIAKNKLKGEGPSATMSVEVQDKSLRKTLLSDIQAMEEIRFAEEL